MKHKQTQGTKVRPSAIFSMEELAMHLPNGKRFAHNLVAFSKQHFTDPDVLKLTDDDGWSVGHETARQGFEVTDPEVLALADNKGVTVEQVQLDYLKRHEERAKEAIKS